MPGLSMRSGVLRSSAFGVSPQSPTSRWAVGDSPRPAPFSPVVPEVAGRWPLASSRLASGAERTVGLPPLTRTPFLPALASLEMARFPTSLSVEPTGERGTAASLVYRSPLVDQSEPELAQRDEASTLLSGSTGVPLAPMIRRSMEQRLGLDLAAVRVHSGPTVMRAANLIAARAMTRGTDVYLPGGVPDDPSSPEVSLLAHELTHVAHHQGTQLATPAIHRTMTRPLTLARRTSDQEREADQIERGVADGLRELRRLPTLVAQPTPPPPELTLSRPVAPVVQRAEEPAAVAPVTASVAIAPTGSEGTPAEKSTEELADQVFQLLERRLMVERERGGFRR